MSDVVVDLAKTHIVSKLDRPLEAIECHVVLGCVERAQTNIVPKFALVDSALNESPVKSKSHFGLVCVKMIGGDRSNCFDVVVVESKHFLVN